MWNCLPRTSQAYSLLYGKRPLQRVIVGTKGQQLEIPLNVVSDLAGKCDESATYIGNKYVALPWEEFSKVKQDANNLIHANVKSALTGLDWFPSISTLAQGQTAQLEAHAMKDMVSRKHAKFSYPVAQ
jgi:hypothetical protein